MLKKNKGRQSVTQQANEAEFVCNLDDLLDISHLRALDMITIPEDRGFLLAQPEKGLGGSMVGMDAKLTATEKQSIERREQVLVRKRRMEDLKRGDKKNSRTNILKQQQRY